MNKTLMPNKNFLSKTKKISDTKHEKICEIQNVLRQHYGNISLLYAFCAEEKKPKTSLKKRKLTQDTKRLLWTITNLQSQILPLESELHQLLNQ